MNFFSNGQEALLPRAERLESEEEIAVEQLDGSRAWQILWNNALDFMVVFRGDSSDSESRESVEMQRCFLLIIKVLVAVAALIVVLGVYLWCSAIEATYEYSSKACDVPLNKYLFLQLGLTWLISSFKLQDGSLLARLISAFFTSMLSFTPVALGLFWIFSSRNCPRTNPQLYYAVAHLLYFEAAGICGMVVLVLLIVGCSRGRLSVEFQGAGGIESGCAEAVLQMPIVPSYSPTLVEQDGTPSECVICLDALRSATVRKTPCNHHFHEDCLTQWCVGHRKCPICKRDLAAYQSAPF